MTQESQLRRHTITFRGRSSELVLGRGASRELTTKLAGRPAFLVADANVMAGFPDALPSDLGRLILPGGEASKQVETMIRLWEGLANANVDRSGVLVAWGGGVVGDAAGFAAASWLRGIECIQIPTTLLAMVDSSVGGKTGINLPQGKNLVGAFHQPTSVLIDQDFLATLPAREFAAGMAEVIKYGLLADADLFARLETGPVLTADAPDLASVIETCCLIKAQVVEADEQERAAHGGRALLNLGHTFGHAVEAVAGYGHYLHGEAIAIGLVAAGLLSEKLGLLDPGASECIRNVVTRYHLPSRIDGVLPLDALEAATQRDKKVRAGKLTFIAMEQIGQAVTRKDIPDTLVREVWKEVGAT